MVNTIEEAKSALEKFLGKNNLEYTEAVGPTPFGEGHSFRLVTGGKTYLVFEDGHIVD